MVPHVRLCTVQESLELETVGIAVRNNIAHLADDRGKDEDTNQVADDGEHVPNRWYTLIDQYQQYN